MKVFITLQFSYFLYYKDPSYRGEMFSFNSERLFSVKSVQSMVTAFLVLNCKIQLDYIQSALQYKSARKQRSLKNHCELCICMISEATTSPEKKKTGIINKYVEYSRKCKCILRLYRWLQCPKMFPPKNFSYRF